MRINRLKKVIKVFLIILAILLIIVIAIVGCALITYHKQPVLTEEDKEELSVDNIWKTRTEPEMAEVIEDNGDALLERIKLISNARDEIILSTFDFRADDSGKLILGALLDASERGVSVNVIVDGVSGFLRMNGNPYFEALAAGEGTSIKIYNKVNPFAPWKSMGRLHDKYLIADRSSYIIGGRNTFSYFLGSSSPYKNYDRDALVYCENPDENSSVNDILSYFGKVWNYKESKAFINGVNALTDTDTYFTISEKNEYNYCVENTYSHNNSVDSSRITDKKNITIYLYTHPEKFKVRLLPLPAELEGRFDLRFTLDTMEDFTLLQELYATFHEKTDRSVHALLQLVQSHPDYRARMLENIARNEK